MVYMHNSSHRRMLLHNTKLTMHLLGLALSMGGCAQLPSLNESAVPKTPSTYQTSQSFASSVCNWPDERWWEGYQDPQLNLLIDDALKDSPDLAAAFARLHRAEAFGQISGASLKPQISANAAATEQKLSYNYLTPRSMTPNGWNDYGKASLDFSWELDFWGKNRAALAAATSQIEASHAELAQAKLILASVIAANYAELAHLFAQQETLSSSIAVRAKTTRLFQERFANGLETKGAISTAQARLAEAEGDLLIINEQIGLQRNRLSALVGAGPDRGLSIKHPVINIQNNLKLPSNLAVDLLGRRPDINAARLQVEAQLSRIDQKKAEFYPNINLSAFIGVQSLGLNMLSDHGSSIGGIGPAISLPLFTAGRLQGELRGAQATYDEVVANYNRTLTQALEEVANAVVSQKALNSQLLKAEEAVSAAQESYRVAHNRYDGGLGNYIDVLYAEDTLLGTKRTLANLQSRILSLDIALKRSLGGGYTHTTISTEGNEYVRN